MLNILNLKNTIFLKVSKIIKNPPTKFQPIDLKRPLPTNRSETVTSNQKSFVQQFFTIEYSSTISYHWTWPRTHPTRPDLTKSPNNTALEIPLEGWFSWPVRSVGRWILQIQSLQNNRISSSKKNYFFCTHLNHFIHSFCTLNPQSISYQPIRSKFRTDIYTH